LQAAIPHQLTHDRSNVFLSDQWLHDQCACIAMAGIAIVQNGALNATWRHHQITLSVSNADLLQAHGCNLPC
jgi:hypothetical protein